MEKILTVTVPSYNVEKFLENTLDSFVDERVLDDIEVLIVDDGSKDKTAEIGRKYEEKYPDTFRVISKENGGHGSTINRGIGEAKGKYFKVVDGDDWVDQDGFAELIQRLKTCDADYVFTNYYEVNDVTGELNPRDTVVHTLNCKTGCCCMFFLCHSSGFTCCSTDDDRICSACNLLL